jgi:hypothetical protein
MTPLPSSLALSTEGVRRVSTRGAQLRPVREAPDRTGTDLGNHLADPRLMRGRGGLYSARSAHTGPSDTDERFGEWHGFDLMCFGSAAPVVLRCEAKCSSGSANVVVMG